MMHADISRLSSEAAQAFPDLKPPIPPAPPRPMLFVPFNDRVLFCGCDTCVHRRQFGCWLARLRFVCVWLLRAGVGVGVTLGLAGYPLGYWVAAAWAGGSFHGALQTVVGEILLHRSSVRSQILNRVAPTVMWTASWRPHELKYVAAAEDYDKTVLDEDSAWMGAIEYHQRAGTLPLSLQVWWETSHAGKVEEEE